MVSLRKRGRSDNVHGGNAKYKSGVVFAQSGLQVLASSESCEDFERSPGDADCQPLIVESFDMDVGRLNGQSGTAIFDGYVPTFYRDHRNFGHLVVNAPSDNWLANNAVSRTNPSRPHVDMPLYVLELADLLSLLRSAGKGLARNIGHHNLGYQFGIAPLISDVVSISQFMDQFGRRAKELETLRVKGIRRTVQQGEVTGFLNRTNTVQSEGAVISMTGRAMTTVKCSSHIRWFPDGAFKTLSSKHTRLMAQDVIVGLSNGRPYVDLSTLWELIPWSWLIDYAVDISTFLKGTRNIIPCRYTGPFVMRETTTTWTYPGRKVKFNDPAQSITEVTAHGVTRSSKTRKLVGATPFAAVPFLSGTQMGIIASLAVTQKRR